MELYYHCKICNTQNFFKTDNSKPSVNIDGLEFSCDKCNTRYKISVKPLSKNRDDDDSNEKGQFQDQVDETEIIWKVPDPGDYESPQNFGIDLLSNKLNRGLNFRSKI